MTKGIIHLDATNGFNISLSNFKQWHSSTDLFFHAVGRRGICLLFRLLHQLATRVATSHIDQACSGDLRSKRAFVGWSHVSEQRVQMQTAAAGAMVGCASLTVQRECAPWRLSPSHCLWEGQVAQYFVGPLAILAVNRTSETNHFPVFNSFTKCI